MHNETRISSRQAILLILFAHIATTVNFIPSSLLNFLTQDAWISIIPGAILAIMFSYYPIADLGIRFPGQSLVQLSEKLLGTVLGKLYGFIIVYIVFMLHCWTLRNFGELMVAVIPGIPMWVFIAGLSLTTSYAVKSGLNIITNITLLRRRIKTPRLKIETMVIGLLTNTEVKVVYIKGIINDQVVEEVKIRLSRINTDAILESGYIEEFIEDEPYSPFSQINITERPDKVAGSLLEGQLAIFVDNTPLTNWLQMKLNVLLKIQYRSAKNLNRTFLDLRTLYIENISVNGKKLKKIGVTFIRIYRLMSMLRQKFGYQE